LAKGKKVTYNIPVSERYPAEGPATLTDGKQGGWSYLPGSGRWQGFLSDIDVVIDLEEVREIHYIGATFMHFYPHEVCAPCRVVVSFSDDGEHFTEAAAIDSDVPEKDTSTLFFLYGAPVSGKARYVRFQAFQGSRPWLFTDEIIVN
ncbi:MAG: beta-N-acetylhexosaminidase, partial [Bacteroidales bacterium]|nr:beta-N-acetylhexosaminidase [Bacteroidales bacterium]